MKSRKNKNYYVVIRGRNVGVFDNWPECEEQILYYHKAFYKKVESLDQAMGLICEHMWSDGPYFIHIGRYNKRFSHYDMFLDCLERMAKENC